MLEERHWNQIADRISELTGKPFRDPIASSIGGGCINSAWQLSESENLQHSYFVKLNAASCAAMFSAESEALKALGATGTIRVPHPICEGIADSSAFLVLEYIEMRGNADEEVQARTGSELAALHKHTSESGKFGWHRDNTIGSTPQKNAWESDWIRFFAEQRLQPQLDLASSKGRTFSEADRLLEILPGFFDSYQPMPSLLHGDLWGGNAASDALGNPVIFDPATYYGDRGDGFGLHGDVWRVFTCFLRGIP